MSSLAEVWNEKDTTWANAGGGQAGGNNAGTGGNTQQPLPAPPIRRNARVEHPIVPRAPFSLFRTGGTMVSGEGQVAGSQYRGMDENWERVPPQQPHPQPQQPHPHPQQPHRPPQTAPPPRPAAAPAPPRHAPAAAIAKAATKAAEKKRKKCIWTIVWVILAFLLVGIIIAAAVRLVQKKKQNGDGLAGGDTLKPAALTEIDAYSFGGGDPSFSPRMPYT